MKTEEDIILNSENELTELFKKAEEICLFNQRKVLQAFKNHKISLRHFYPSTGYGYGDEGREALSKLFAEIFQTEAALATPYIVSGTHAISLGLFSVLMPGDLFVCVTGKPYDTLNDCIFKKDSGSLLDYSVKCDIIEMADNKIDTHTVLDYVKQNNPRMVYIQRSRGYEWRDALKINDIENICKKLRASGFEGCIMVDNCYGEFLDCIEPSQVGADLIAGSLIKNPGGGLALTGGYLAGKQKYISFAEKRLTAPSLGSEVGSYAASYQSYFQGLFLAAHTVCQAVKGALLFNKVFSKAGYTVSPVLDGSIPSDLITAIRFNDKDKLIKFINSIQSFSPIDSYLTAEPWDMPGYNSQVIMAAGCFVQGSSIELSADAPVKPPYIAYVQGGLTYEHCRIAVEECLKIIGTR